MRRLGIALVVAAFAACSSSPSGNNNNGNNDGGGGSDGSNNNNPGADSGTLPQNTTFGTYIPLGDSISDNGGIGPFFYDLLHTNDDAMYPEFKGHDLSTKFPGIMYEHDAIAGSITDSYTDLSGLPTLKGQIDGLGHTYPGDVLVTITIGGNDLNGHALAAINGTDGAARTAFAQHLADELTELTAPGRLGTGKVYVVLANIYDFTDGQGDFATVACGPPANVLATKDVSVFTAWNGLMADAINTAGGQLYDMHADFMGHGYNATTDVWYDKASCIHPNAAGHAEIRKSIWKLVTGESP
jgi:lysophospholipase L1-like esterase